MTRVAWSPNPGSQQLMLGCPVSEVLLEGTRGGGKTECLLIDFAQHVGKGYGTFWRGVLFRQTYKQLEDVLVKSRRMFKMIFPDAVFKAGDQFKWVWPTGEELLLRQIKTVNDYWDYHGHEYPWIGWEELTNWKNLDVYDTMKACNRSSHPGLPRRIASTCNPLGIGHSAVKERFIDPAPWGHLIQDGRIARVRIHSSFVENPYIYVNDPEYVAKLQDISDPNVRKAWLEGSWDIVAGGALDDLYDKDKHILHNIEYKDIPKDWPITRSFDWGSSAPFSVGWHATSTGGTMKDRFYPQGTKVRISEWYGAAKENRAKGLYMTNTDMAKGIIEKEEAMYQQGLKQTVRPGAADAQIFYGDHGTGFTIADEFANEGVHFIPCIKGQGSRRLRLALFRDKLKASLKDNMEEAGYFALDTCQEFQRQMPLLARDPNDYEAVDTDSEDHLYDELTYEIITATGGGSMTSVVI